MASQRKPIPFALLLLDRIFNPMQGLFNILVYCRPHVSSLRNHNLEYSWLKAFWLIVKSGGDNDSAGQSRRSNSGSHRGSQAVLDRMERNHILMMAKIHKAKNPSNSFVLNDNNDDADPEVSETEDRVGEDCGSQCLTPKEAAKLDEVDDESSSLDDIDALIIDRVAQLTIPS